MATPEQIALQRSRSNKNPNTDFSGDMIGTRLEECRIELIRIQMNGYD